MWQTKVSVVPVVVGALGIVKQGQADNYCEEFAW